MAHTYVAVHDVVFVSMSRYQEKQPEDGSRHNYEVVKFTFTCDDGSQLDVTAFSRGERVQVFVGAD